MKLQNDGYYTNRHSCFLLQYHLVFVTKYQHPVLVGDLQRRLAELIELYFKEKVILKEFAIQDDHVHILFDGATQTRLDDFVNGFKTFTSRKLRKEFADFLVPYYWKPYFGAPSYFIASVSDASTAVVQQYILAQK